MIVSLTGNKTTIMQSYVSGESYSSDFQQVEQVHAAARALQRFWRAHKVRRFYSLTSNVGDERSEKVMIVSVTDKAQWERVAVKKLRKAPNHTLKLRVLRKRVFKVVDGEERVVDSARRKQFLATLRDMVNIKVKTNDDGDKIVKLQSGAKKKSKSANKKAAKMKNDSNTIDDDRDSELDKRLEQQQLYMIAHPGAESTPYD